MTPTDPVDRGLIRERALARIGRVVTSSLDLHAILRGALAVLRETVTFKGGSIALLNEAGELEITVAVGVLDAEAAAVRLPRGQGIAGWVVAHGEPFLSNDLDHETRVELPTRATGTNRLIRSYLAVPLIAGGDVIGLLQIDSERPGAFTEGDVELLAAAGSQVAGAVRNARLFAAVLDERERLRAVLRELPHAVVIVDPAGRIVEANAAAAALWGRRGDTRGQVSTATFPVLRLDRTPFPHRERPVVRALRGETVSGVEMLYVGPDDREVIIEASAAPLRDHEGRITAAVAVYQDVTAARTMDIAKDEFVATAGHDLRNPLTTLKGLVQLLQRRAQRGVLDPEATTQALDGIARQVERMAEMLDTLLDVSRIQMGRLELETEPVDVRPLARETVEQWRLTATGHDFNLSLPETPAIACAERTRVLQVLGNLLSNAVKYSPDGGRIDLTVESFEDEVRLSVRDQGIGVPAAALPRLFDRFFRTEAARGRQLEGTGLGLYICKGLVEAMGGHIGAESAGPGAGTRVWFTLPRAQDDTDPLLD